MGVQPSSTALQLLRGRRARVDRAVRARLWRRQGARLDGPEAAASSRSADGAERAQPGQQLLPCRIRSTQPPTAGKPALACTCPSSSRACPDDGRTTREGPARPDHPDHALFKQIQAGVARGPGRGEDADRMSHNLLALARRGINRADHVMLGGDGAQAKVFLVQGHLQDPRPAPRVDRCQPGRADAAGRVDPADRTRQRRAGVSAPQHRAAPTQAIATGLRRRRPAANWAARCSHNLIPKIFYLCGWRMGWPSSSVRWTPAVAVPRRGHGGVGARRGQGLSGGERRNGRPGTLTAMRSMTPPRRMPNWPRARRLHPNLSTVQRRPWGALEFAMLDPCTVCSAVASPDGGGGLGQEGPADLGPDVGALAQQSSSAGDASLPRAATPCAPTRGHCPCAASRLNQSDPGELGLDRSSGIGRSSS